MIVRMFSRKTEGKVYWGVLLEDDERRMELHPGDLEKTMTAYEKLTGKELTEEELMGLQIA